MASLNVAIAQNGNSGVAQVAVANRSDISGLQQQFSKPTIENHPNDHGDDDDDDDDDDVEMDESANNFPNKQPIQPIQPAATSDETNLTQIASTNNNSNPMKETVVGYVNMIAYHHGNYYNNSSYYGDDDDSTHPHKLRAVCTILGDYASRRTDLSGGLPKLYEMGPIERARVATRMLHLRKKSEPPVDPSAIGCHVGTLAKYLQQRYAPRVQCVKQLWEQCADGELGVEPQAEDEEHDEYHTHHHGYLLPHELFGIDEEPPLWAKRNSLGVDPFVLPLVLEVWDWLRCFGSLVGIEPAPSVAAVAHAFTHPDGKHDLRAIHVRFFKYLRDRNMLESTALGELGVTGHAWTILFARVLMSTLSPEENLRVQDEIQRVWNEGVSETKKNEGAGGGGGVSKGSWRKNSDVCSGCGGYGTVIGCGSCTRSYHIKCVGLKSFPESWECVECLQAKGGNSNNNNNNNSNNNSRDDEKEEQPHQQQEMLWITNNVKRENRGGEEEDDIVHAIVKLNTQGYEHLDTRTKLNLFLQFLRFLIDQLGECRNIIHNSIGLNQAELMDGGGPSGAHNAHAAHHQQQQQQQHQVGRKGSKNVQVDSDVEDEMLIDEDDETGQVDVTMADQETDVSDADSVKEGNLNSSMQNNNNNNGTNNNQVESSLPSNLAPYFTRDSKVRMMKFQKQLARTAGKRLVRGVNYEIESKSVAADSSGDNNGLAQDVLVRIEGYRHRLAVITEICKDSNLPSEWGFVSPSSSADTEVDSGDEGGAPTAMQTSDTQQQQVPAAASSSSLPRPSNQPQLTQRQWQQRQQSYQRILSCFSGCSPSTWRKLRRRKVVALARQRNVILPPASSAAIPWCWEKLPHRQNSISVRRDRVGTDSWGRPIWLIPMENKVTRHTAGNSNSLKNRIHPMVVCESASGNWGWCGASTTEIVPFLASLKSTTQNQELQDTLLQILGENTIMRPKSGNCVNVCHCLGSPHDVINIVPGKGGLPMPKHSMVLTSRFKLIQQAEVQGIITDLDAVIWEMLAIENKLPWFAVTDAFDWNGWRKSFTRFLSKKNSKPNDDHNSNNSKNDDVDNNNDSSQVNNNTDEALLAVMSALKTLEQSISSRGVMVHRAWAVLRPEFQVMLDTTEGSSFRPQISKVSYAIRLLAFKAVKWNSANEGLDLTENLKEIKEIRDADVVAIAESKSHVHMEKKYLVTMAGATAQRWIPAEKIATLRVALDYERQLNLTCERRIPSNAVTALSNPLTGDAAVAALKAFALPLHQPSTAQPPQTTQQEESDEQQQQDDDHSIEDVRWYCRNCGTCRLVCLMKDQCFNFQKIFNCHLCEGRDRARIVLCNKHCNNDPFCDACAEQFGISWFPAVAGVLCHEQSWVCPACSGSCECSDCKANNRTAITPTGASAAASGGGGGGSAAAASSSASGNANPPVHHHTGRGRPPLSSYQQHHPHGNAADPSTFTPRDIANGFSKIQKFLNDTIKTAQSKPFRHPVTIYGYNNVIDKPMDLTTLRRKVHDGEYENGEDAVTDMRLIWSNCIAYNGAGSELGRVAQDFSCKFEKMLDTLLCGPEWQRRARLPSSSGTGSCVHGGGVDWLVGSILDTKSTKHGGVEYLVSYLGRPEVPPRWVASRYVYAAQLVKDYEEARRGLIPIDLGKGDTNSLIINNADDEAMDVCHICEQPGNLLMCRNFDITDKSQVAGSAGKPGCPNVFCQSCYRGLDLSPDWNELEDVDWVCPHCTDPVKCCPTTTCGVCSYTTHRWQKCSGFCDRDVCSECLPKSFGTRWALNHSILAPEDKREPWLCPICKTKSKTISEAAPSSKRLRSGTLLAAVFDDDSSNNNDGDDVSWMPASQRRKAGGASSSSSSSRPTRSRK